jgi:sugar lactone lactonase YvrE
LNPFKEVSILITLETTVLLDGLMFPEAPRWHDGKLWFSDMQAYQVMTVDLAGNAEKIVEVPGQPSGLGWLPTGQMLVVSMVDRRLMRLDPEGLTEIADLSELASFHCNDMVVDREGRSYIGNFGFALNVHPFERKPAEIVLVLPDGESRVVADKMIFPNGSVITPDGHQFIVAETFGHRLTAFDIKADGSLKGRRIWAQLDGIFPDGICLDAEGAIWVASPGKNGVVLRVRKGGEVTHRVNVDTTPYACMLGGPDRRTLFVLTSETSDPTGAQTQPSGRIEIVQVDIPGAGLP